jgi:predicted AAA+ superfamily ATPase
MLNISSFNAFLNSPHAGNLWENFVLTEYIKEGFQAGKNLFYFRDQNAVEIDFILEKEGQVYLVEAKNNERPSPKKLNFSKIAPLFKQQVKTIVACAIEEKGMIYLKDYSDHFIKLWT